LKKSKRLTVEWSGRRFVLHHLSVCLSPSLSTLSYYYM